VGMNVPVHSVLLAWCSISIQACGSAYYIAPEVFTRRFTKACDVWSCGIILYLMLSGTVPFGYEVRRCTCVCSRVSRRKQRALVLQAEEELQVYESIQRDPLKLESKVGVAAELLLSFFLRPAMCGVLSGLEFCVALGS
jgi:serine/threonine protein kinase